MTQMPEPSFLMIVQLHHLQAMLQLGLVPNPATGKPNAPNPMMASRELALLQILREKTAGNLDAEEQELLDKIIESIATVLQELDS